MWENVLDQPGSPVHLKDWDTGQVFVSMVTEEHFTLQGGKLVKYLYIITRKTILRTPANKISFCQPPTSNHFNFLNNSLLQYCFG